MREKIFLSAPELSNLMALYNQAQQTPVIALSMKDGLAGDDWASQAWKRFKDEWEAIATKHGVSKDAGFNSMTGEVII